MTIDNISRYYKLVTGCNSSPLIVDQINAGFEKVISLGYKMGCVEELAIAGRDIEALEFYLRVSNKSIPCPSVFVEVMIRVAECDPDCYSRFIKDKRSVVRIISILPYLFIDVILRFFKGYMIYAVNKKILDCRRRACRNCCCTAI